MDFLHRAFLSIRSKKGSFLLQVLILAIVASLILTGLLIQTASNKATALTKASIGSTVTFQNNPNQQLAASSSGQRPTFKTSSVSLSDAKKLASISYVASYNFLVNAQANAGNFTAIKSSNDSSQTSSNNIGGPQQSNSNRSMQTGDLTIEGVSNLSALDEFKQGTSKITSGTSITSSSEAAAVINQKLAQEDGLKVGDTIKIKNVQGTKTLALKIAGFYQTSSSGSNTANMFTSMNPYNRIYVNYKDANELKGTTTSIDSAVYTMDDASHIQSFEKKAKAISSISWKKYTLISNDSTYKSLVSSISGIGSFSKNLVYIVTIAGLAIISLVVMMQIKNRKYEVGVLMGIGEGKGKIISQFVLETVMAAILAFVVALSVGQPIAHVVSDKLANSYSNTSSTTQMSGTGQGGGPGNAPAMASGGPRGSQNVTAAKTKLTVTMNYTDGIKTVGIATGIAVLSVLLPSIAIMRLKPKEILTRQE
ncbi:FtsX-like permease family protein [Sporolactobacillus sp. CQH2019]|uniref:ABC transporter permease n=1 Tax=Sporolactobacillus sp. CQH2019 TaxID=3023512 RepID=UPI002367D018|nr:FtsX-like permease family protein [Sporolactobacillus sp. CQH2019]MDD9150285.1 FtsX-like permease family protein [Sporolactobacillus sp. CQH2019]